MIQKEILFNQDNSGDIITNFGRWTSTEHKFFLEGVKNYGLYWRKVNSFKLKNLDRESCKISKQPPNSVSFPEVFKQNLQTIFVGKYDLN